MDEKMQIDVNKAFDLTDRVALITGASSWGIGSASAEALAEKGAKVFLVARREEQLQQKVKEFEDKGYVAAYAVCDVEHEEECKAAVEKCIETFGRLDILVTSAGNAGEAPYEIADEFDTDNWRWVHSLNLDGSIWFLKYAWKECSKHKVGSVVFISSLGAFTADGCAAYCSTKGALRSLTTHFGYHLAPFGVRVNCIYPGYIASDLTKEAFCDPNASKPFLERIPMGRMGVPEDIAYGTLFLASDASSFMTGQGLIIDGGQLIEGRGFLEYEG